MLRRRDFLGQLTAGVLAGSDYPTRTAKVEPLWRSPDGHPNGLEAAGDGLWVGEQITDRAWLLDWKTGKPLVKFETQSSNTSGIACGGGYVWMAANGAAHLRPSRPHDVAKGGRIVKLDAKTGEHIRNYSTPNGGGVHGLVWCLDSLWITQFGPNKNITRTDAELNFIHSFPVPFERAHGLAWDGESIWCMFSNDRRMLKFDIRDGRVLEAVQLSETDPDPHGLTCHEGVFYYCDAGIAPGHKSTGSRSAGFICRIHL
mgnify:CR=1